MQVMQVMMDLVFGYMWISNAMTRNSLQSSIFCIDKTLRQFEPPISNPDDNWRTKPSTIVPIDKTPFTVRPEVITFDAVNVLIEPSQSVGRWYREALHTVCDMKVRLPRPDFFTAAFNKAFADMLVI